VVVTINRQIAINVLEIFCVKLEVVVVVVILGGFGIKYSSSVPVEKIADKQ